MDIVIIPEAKLNRDLKKAIQTLLTTCFPYEQKYEKNHYQNEKPDYRLIVYENSEIIAHSAVYEKKMTWAGTDETFSGIGIVCVAREHRQKGITKNMLMHIEENRSHNNFFMLLGSPIYYSSSGYKRVNNVFFQENPEENCEFALVKTRQGSRWPASGKVVIEGLPF